MAVVNLTPSRVDLQGVRAGDRNLVSWTIRSGGVPVDLTGKTVEAQARLTADNEAALSAVVEVLDEVNGTGTLRWPGDELRDLLAGETKFAGVWDMQVTTPGEDPVTVAAGVFLADMDVTRP